LYFGWRATVGSLFVSEIFREARKLSGNFTAPTRNHFDLVLVEVTQAESNMNHAPDFTAGSLGNLKKPGKVDVGGSLRSFRNVVRDRDHRTLHLFRVRPIMDTSHDTVYNNRKITRILPDLHGFKILQSSIITQHFQDR
jgi:hypothetical protein